MSEIWKYKFGATVFAAFISLYLILPSFLGVKEHRAELKKQRKAEPWYYSLLPENELNLGLDLRGGMYLELEVGIKDAVTNHMDTQISDIQRYFLKDNLKDGKVTRVSNSLLRVEIQRSLFKDFKHQIDKYYGRGSFEYSEEPKEIYVKTVGDKKQDRVSIIKTLKAKGLEVDVRFLKEKNLLAVTYKNDEQQVQILSALKSDSLAGLNVEKRADNILYMIPSSDYIDKVERDIIEQAANSVRNRIDRYGVAESSVSRSAGNRLVVELPGVKNPDNVISIVKKTGKLEFRMVDESKTSRELELLILDVKKKLGLRKEYQDEELKKLNSELKADLPQGSELAFELVRHPKTKKVLRSIPYLLKKKADVTGNMIDTARVETQNNQPYVTLNFGKVGAKKFAKLTRDNVGKQLAIVLDGIVMSAPNINEPIPNGQARITLGQFSNYNSILKEAKDLALILKEGALPAKLKVGTKNVIGPSLGKDSIEAGVKSILISAVIILLFMLAYYRVAGVVANLALILNVSMIFAALCILQASLTLPGMAGIVLTLGMAVDANVIIFERMREEKVKGKDLGQIIYSGYSNAISAIVDGNVTTFIAGLVLFEFGTGPIKGFATTLMIGIACTLFTAIFVTRVIYDWLYGTNKIKTIGF